MQIALVGMGRMGRMIKECAEARGIEVAGEFDAANIDALAELPVVDALIDFSAPASLGAVEAYVRRSPRARPVTRPTKLSACAPSRPTPR